MKTAEDLRCHLEAIEFSTFITNGELNTRTIDQIKVSREKCTTVFLVNLIIVIGSPSSTQDFNPTVKGPGGWDTILAFTSNQTTAIPHWFESTASPSLALGK